MSATNSATATTLIARLWPARRENALLRGAALVLLGTALLAVSAHIQVPFWPVKLSMQSFVVLSIGLTYGRRLAAATIAAYLIEGAFGLPVFQSGAGLAYMAGPTAGYLLGYLLAATAMGALAERGAVLSPPRAIAAVLLGEVLIYAPGIAWLAMLFGPAKAIAYGLTPFLPAEGAKILLAVMLLPGLRRLTRQTPGE